MRDEDTTMSDALRQFVTMIRTYSITLFCDTCGTDRLHYLARETARQEVYTCAHCGAEKAYTVR